MGAKQTLNSRLSGYAEISTGGELGYQIHRDGELVAELDTETLESALANANRWCGADLYAHILNTAQFADDSQARMVETEPISAETLLEDNDDST